MSKIAWCTNVNKNRAIVRYIQRHSADVVTIYFLLDTGGVLSYQAGQYVTVQFDGASSPEGKAYSLSSAPYESLMSITVKKIGEYSGLLHALHVGDMFFVSDAYGHFNPNTPRPLICIAAGVGIAPIWSVIKQEYESNSSRHARIFYSNKTVGDIAFHDELSLAVRNRSGLEVSHHVTRQGSVPSSISKARIDIDECVTAARECAMYLLCGSSGFVRSMWQGLAQRGVAAELISTETFFES